ncbi:MAG: nuclear transport factor 2 family protein [Frankiales bacterium]|nr:nuclear transport factor 2 family protein [Frankiales bacterium]
MITDVVDRWHRYVTGAAPEALDELLADDVVFYSPVVFTPQRGKDITRLYLQAAAQALPGDGTDGGSFRYTKRVLDGDVAVLEFETRDARVDAELSGRSQAWRERCRYSRPRSWSRPVGRCFSMSESRTSGVTCALRARYTSRCGSCRRRPTGCPGTASSPASATSVRGPRLWRRRWSAPATTRSTSPVA